MKYGTSLTSIFSLYRTFLREVGRLPSVYLQQFFRIKVADDVRTILASRDNSHLLRVRINKVSKELSKIEAANRRNVKAFAHVLDIAYGRKGKLRWEIMKPLLSDPGAPKPPPIIKGEPRSCPPVFSPELTALLTSPHSCHPKPLPKASLTSPPALPARADPLSEEARLLGPFSKRREVNIRWRFFTKEWKKIFPPLQLDLKATAPPLVASDEKTSPLVGVRGIGMQGSGVFEDIERLAGPPWVARSPTRRERRGTCCHSSGLPHSSSTERLPTRWIRRRYRQLLGRLPILTYRANQGRGLLPGTYRVSLSPSAITSTCRHTAQVFAKVDAVDMTWLDSGTSSVKGKRKS